MLRTLPALCLGVVSVVSFADVAFGASTGAHQRSAGPVGDYAIFTGRSPSGTLTLNSDGTFTRSNGDSGTWLVWKDNVVLDVFSSTAGNMACIYLGADEKTGIGTRGDPGPSNCHETRGTWYAVRTTQAISRQKRAVTTPSTMSSPSPDSTAGNVRVIGTYDESNSTLKPASKSQLHIEADGHYYLIAAPDLEVGYWVVHNGAIAFAVVDSQFGTLAGCTFVGILTTQGIDSARSRGLLDCNGSKFSWYAARVKG
ncbi:MAG TPA: hypothetical protein VID75_13935 [Acidimicrobiales bacterium]